MTNQITIEKLTLVGFRAYLKEQTLLLREGQRPLSLAVFSPNAKGKSSLVDALEFFFSPEGTLERLGQRRVGTKVGREALEHIDVEKLGINPRVTLAFREGPEPFDGTRPAMKTASPLPDAAQRVLRGRKVNFIIRGYKLRHFAETQTPQERYDEISDWLGLSFLTEVERNLRKLRLKLAERLQDDKAKNERLEDLKKATNGILTELDEEQVLNWINTTQIALLDAELRLSSLDISCKAYKAILQREEDEKQKTGLDILEQVLSGVQDVYFKDAPQPDETKKDSGSIIDYEEAWKTLAQGRAEEKRVHGESAKAVFEGVWNAASKIFEDPTIQIEVCPVCATPLQETAKGGREGICLHLRTELENLEAYRQAVQVRKTAETATRGKLDLVRTTVAALIPSLKAANYNEEAEIVEGFNQALTEEEEPRPLPDPAALKRALATLMLKVDAECKRIRAKQGEQTYENARQKIDQLISLKERLEELEKVQHELRNIHEALVKSERFISGEIRRYIQSILTALEDDTNVLFKAVHVEEAQAPKIYLRINEQATIPQLDLLVDFAPNRQMVVPSGYLSDSQLHTLALSLRLSSIRLFNKGLPLIVLDDVVSAYDADNRRAIAGMLADHFRDFQIILVTLDERFFEYLTEQLPKRNWCFKRIKRLDPEFGPRFHDHKIRDEQIEEKLEEGESVGNLIRQAEEEWLLQICREFGVESFRIRNVHKPYDYERSELAEGLIRFLNTLEMKPPFVPGVANPFLESLQQGNVENFSSHFSDNAYAFSSPGDEEQRWNEFKYFRDLFICPDCGGRRFQRPHQLKKPVCQKGNCEAQFAFPTSDA